MADHTVVHIGENSVEQIAYRLMERVADIENRSIHTATPDRPSTAADRAWILDTFAECLVAARGFRKIKS